MVKTETNSLIDPKFIGIPYKFKGREFEGADCIGLMILWFREQGIEYEYDDGQGPVMAHWWEHNPRRFLDAYLALGKIVHFQDVKKNDVLLLLGDDLSCFPSCLGVMVDNRHMLVSFEEKGSFVTMLNSHWKKRFFGAIRLHKVAGRFGD